MKTNKQTNKSKFYLAIVFSISLLIFGCKKHDDKIQADNLTHQFKNKAEAKAYVNERLDKYAKVIASLAKNETVRKVVNEAVGKKFDGDYNVLLKDLPNLLRKNNANLKLQTTAGVDHSGSKMFNDPPVEGPGGGEIPMVDLVALEELLTEPIVVNADTLYPQIYIPFSEPVEEDEDDPCLIAPLTGPIASYPYPVVVPYDGDETTGQDVFDGYTYDANGLEVPCGGISECFAKTHTVWAVTFNERVTQGGITNPTSGPPPTTLPTVQRPDLYIPSMIIKEHKESWIKGKSDICMYAGTSWDNGIDPSSGQYSVSFKTIKGLISLTNRNNDVNNIEIRKFSRNEINKQKEVPIDFTYFPLSSEVFSGYDPCFHILLRDNKTAQENIIAYDACVIQNPNMIVHYFFPERGDYLYYTIYEYDTGWFDLIGYKTALVAGNNYNQKIYYQSNENPYISGRLKILPKDQPTQSYQNTGWANVSNGAISLTSRHR
ncbi:MAG: hypothetical protein EOO91_14150 [Pedobacter sp.]|nr:MAG: hypothetical protein EOO91_14150 [Pedobacter sp.]